MPVTTIPPSSAVSATLLYFTPMKDSSHPYFHINEDPSRPKQNWEHVKHVLEIENICGKEDTVSLDTSGEIEREHYLESIELIKKLTGASKVVLFDHTICCRRPGVLDSDPSKCQPVTQVHFDQTTKSTHARVVHHLPPSKSPELLKHHREKDFTPMSLIYPDKEGEILGVNYNPGHKWKYMKGMTLEEVVLIKCSFIYALFSVMIHWKTVQFFPPSPLLILSLTIPSPSHSYYKLIL
ncbi:hypothetical protein K435DRAFT_783308 [Dendrothele bispora CBS 962.96]|uniref:Uncharacterized protein n=1 Tax=Dendrothele bispora (strain CBS 962.96) TaxID=1314807 RepID=A0A4S8LB10_DENBC|nr:hypothetical protein K435DRAFT_783308 [Dendrothele bispora CBS 962.96]